MSAKTVLGAILAGAWLACAAARAQEPAGSLPPPGAAGTLIPAETGGDPVGGPAATFGPPGPTTMSGPGTPPPQAGPPGTACGGLLPTNTGLSDWILYRRDNGCQCATTGGPMMVELFMRTGVSQPVGGKVLERELDTGWRIEGGGRSLFFDPTWKKAWTIEANIVNIYNGAQSVQQVPLTVFTQQKDINGNDVGKLTKFGQGGIPGVTIRGANRTMVGLGFGREYYLWSSANTPGTHWRIGWDGGGRYGSMKMDFHEIKHRTRVLENGYVAAHTDYEVNCGSCIWYAGARFEWDYTANTILQTQSDFQDLNLLLTLGVRW